MSTAGRVNKPGARRFQPRKGPSAASKDATHASSVTPKNAPASLPQVDEDELPRRDPGPKAPASQHAGEARSPGSAFGPSDPSLRFSQSQSRPNLSPSSSPDRTQPPSSSFGPGFGITPRDPTSTQATSVGPSSQPPASRIFSPRSSPPLVEIPDPPSRAQASTKSDGNPVVKDLTERRAQDKGKGKERQVARDEDASDEERGDTVGGDNGKRRGNRVRPRDEEGLDEQTQPTDQSAKKRSRRVPKAQQAAAARDATQGDDSDAQLSEDEWDKMKPKKRKARKPPRKRGKVDEMLFGSDGDGDEGAAGDDGTGGGVGDAGEHPGEDDGGGDDQGGGGSGAPKRRKKKSSNQQDDDEPLPAVDPSQTTMSQLAEPNPSFEIGRPSERTLFFERQKVDKKLAMKLKRQKMKARQRRKDLGLDSGSEAEGNVEGDGRVASSEGLAGNGNNEAAGGAVPEVTSPQALDAAEAMALIGGLQPADGAENDEEEDDDGEDADGYGDLVETTYAPQMRIVDGHLVLDEESLQIDRSQPTDTGPREVVEESAQDRFVNSRSFSKKPGKAKKWSSEETDRFYDALSQFGTDFELISALFPGRSRREIKLKWTKEDKINPKKITAALMHRKKIDLESYSKYSGQDLSGPIPADPMDEINQRRAKLEVDGTLTGSSGQRRGGEGGQSGDKKGKKKKRGPIDDAGAALFDEGAIQREQEEAERRRLQEEQEEEERQALIDAMEMEE